MESKKDDGRRKLLYSSAVGSRNWRSKRKYRKTVDEDLYFSRYSCRSLLPLSLLEFS